MARVHVLGGLLALSVCACGGGGGGTPAASPPPPNPLYVRVAGNDVNSGGDPADALRTITKAAQIARSGYTIIVGPGTYREGVTTSSVGVPPQGLTFIADSTGGQTGDSPGPVVVNAAGSATAAGFSLSSSPGTIIDGFTITGGADAGIVIKSGSSGGSDNFRIQNSVIFGNPGDGIRVQDSGQALIFNNLIYGNAGSGVNIAGQSSGSPNAHIINNTIFGNQFRGVSVGNTKHASPAAYLRNNIIQNSGTDFSIKVITDPRSDLNYNGDFNLVRPATYSPSAIMGNHDVSADALFVNSGAGDFHLQANSPAMNAGDSLIDMIDLQTRLRGRTTIGGNACDKSALDLGYHYPIVSSCTQ